MRTTVAFIVACVLAVGLAGCVASQQGRVGDADGRDGDPAIDQAPPEAYELTSCTEHYATFAIPASQAAPYLPDGFEPVGSPGQLPEGTAHGLLLWFACDRPAQGDTTGQFWTVLMVDPPARYENQDAELHYVNVMGVTSDPALQGAYQAWGIARMLDGAVGIETVDNEPVTTTHDVRASAGGKAVHVAMELQEAEGPFIDGIVRLFGVHDGAVTGIVDVEFGSRQGVLGATQVVDDGLTPFSIQAATSGGHYWGFEQTLRPTPMGGSR